MRQALQQKATGLMASPSLIRGPLVSAHLSIGLPFILQAVFYKIKLHTHNFVVPLIRSHVTPTGSSQIAVPGGQRSVLCFMSNYFLYLSDSIKTKTE